jgi:low affinity Fe/Cu permease
MKNTFASIATTVDRLLGRPLAFIIALLIIAVWAITARYSTSRTLGGLLSTPERQSLRF